MGSCKVPEGTPHDPRYFSKKRLPWNKGSWCSKCDVSVRIPVHKSFEDLYTAATNEGNNEHYYDIKGKQVDVLILLPVKQMAWRTRDEKGTFIKMINEIVSTVECPCCHATCRAGPLSKTDKRAPKEKTFFTIKKKGSEIIAEKLETAIIIPRADRSKTRSYKNVGRRKDSDTIKEEIDYHVDRIKHTKNTFFEETLDEVPAYLRRKVKRRLEKQNEGKESNIDN